MSPGANYPNVEMLGFYELDDISHRFKVIVVSEVKQNVFQLESASKFKKDPLLLRLVKNDAGIYLYKDKL